MLESTSGDLQPRLHVESCTGDTGLVWSLGNMLSFCTGTLGALPVPVCIVLIVLNPNGTLHVYFVRGKEL